MNTVIMAKKGKNGVPKYYAVAIGRIPGIYYTWTDCQAQTSRYSGAIFKSFDSMQEAQSYLQLHGPSTSNPSLSVTAFAEKAANVQHEICSKRGMKRSHLYPDTDTSLSSTVNIRQTQHSEKFPIPITRITIHFDGGSRGNPGLAGAGAHVVVTMEEKKVQKCLCSTNVTSSKVINANIIFHKKEYFVRKYCGEYATNNYAEYMGLLSGLEVAKSCILNHKCQTSVGTNESPLINLEIYGDSNLIIQQMRGLWKCTHANLRPLYDQCQLILREIMNPSSDTACGIRSNIEIIFEHVRRNLNGIADALANEAMDSRQSWTSNIPFSGSNSTRSVGADSNINMKIDTLTAGESSNSISAPSTKRRVLNLNESEDESDGSNESHYSC